MTDTMDDYESFVDGVASAFWVGAWAESEGVQGLERMDPAQLEELFQRAPEPTTGCYEAASDWADGLHNHASLRTEADVSAMDQVPAYHVGWLLGLDAQGLRGWSWKYARFMPVPRVGVSLSPAPYVFHDDSFCLSYD